MTIERWLRLMESWGFEDNRETFEALIAAYSEKRRHYHTVEHVSACLDHLDRYRQEVQFPNEVEIALWFHDAIYKALSGDNERKSADWAASFLSGHGASKIKVRRVHRLIMATKHDAPARTNDEAVLVDIDLSILGTDPASYRVYEDRVRKEYSLVPFFLYRRKRAEVLRNFLERKRIYTSGCFPDHMDNQARDNLSSAVAALEGRQ